MAKKRIRVGNAILCDYAAKGERNKHTLVNIYSGNVMFDALPVDFAFGLYIEIEDFQPLEEPSQMGLSLRFDGIEQISAVSIAKLGKGTILVPRIAVRIEANATLEVVLSAAGYANTLALTKRFYVRSDSEPT